MIVDPAFLSSGKQNLEKKIEDKNRSEESTSWHNKKRALDSKNVKRFFEAFVSRNIQFRELLVCSAVFIFRS